MITKELAGKILGNLYDAQYEILDAMKKVKKDCTHNLEFNDFYCDLNTAYEELRQPVKRLEAHDK